MLVSPWSKECSKPSRATEEPEAGLPEAPGNNYWQHSALRAMRIGDRWVRLLGGGGAPQRAGPDIHEMEASPSHASTVARHPAQSSLSGDMTYDESSELVDQNHAPGFRQARAHSD